MNEKFEYAFKARPTVFNGHTFDSRHEAMWAFVLNFFKYKYIPHPYDLAFWNPDLEIEVGEGHILAEIKPYNVLDLWREKGIVDKIRKSGIREQWVYLLGQHPTSDATAVVYFDENGNIYDRERLCETAEFDAELLDNAWNAAQAHFRFTGNK